MIFKLGELTIAPVSSAQAMEEGLDTPVFINSDFAMRCHDDTCTRICCRNF